MTIKKYEDFICARTRVFYAIRGRFSVVMVSPSISCNAESVRQERRNSLDLSLWGFHLAMRAFGDCLWPADCSAFDGVRISCSSGAELLEAVEPVFHDSFFRIIFETTPSLLVRPTRRELSRL
ncbi:hypothetical protein T03_84 [Trichinella britovi]|uniref:Uncharacterized protein n=1 Tax=Trichinella britovi TaxID=45882 RepID=A0A0V1DCT7_TRIBR|nr:hypothetical protein T03_84 [Trichinella britovi]